MGRVFLSGGKVGMKMGGSRLPDGYTELEYIRTNANYANNIGPYINTEYKPNNTTKVVMDVQLDAYTATDPAPCLYGCTSGSNAYYVMDTSSGANPFVFMYGTKSVQWDSFDTGKRRTVITDGPVVTLDGNTKTAASNTFTVDQPLFLFGWNQNGTRNVRFSWPLICWGCQIYDNGTLVRDFVPCMADAGEIGLFDLVNNKFYGNAGNGSFVGSEVAA